MIKKIDSFLFIKSGAGVSNLKFVLLKNIVAGDMSSVDVIYGESVACNNFFTNTFIYSHHLLLQHLMPYKPFSQYILV